MIPEMTGNYILCTGLQVFLRLYFNVRQQRMRLLYPLSFRMLICALHYISVDLLIML